MPNDAYTQQALAADPSFHLRVRSALATVAWQVLDETNVTPGHDQRASYARGVINSLQIQAQQIAGWLVERTNIMAGTTSYDFPSRSVVTTATDADLESQLATDWNELANVQLTPPAAR